MYCLSAGESRRSDDATHQYAANSPMLINNNIHSGTGPRYLRALAKDPAVRFSSASQMAAPLLMPARYIQS